MTTNVPQPRITRAELERVAKDALWDYAPDLAKRLNAQRLASEALALIDERDLLLQENQALSDGIRSGQYDRFYKLTAERDAYRKALEKIRDYSDRFYITSVREGKTQMTSRIEHLMEIAQDALSTMSSKEKSDG